MSYIFFSRNDPRLRCQGNQQKYCDKSGPFASARMSIVALMDEIHSVVSEENDLGH